MISPRRAPNRAAAAYSPARAVEPGQTGPVGADLSERELELMTRREQCEYMLSRQPLSILGTFISSTLIVIALSDVSSLEGALIWFAVVLLNLARRVTVYYRYKREGIRESNLRSWETHAFWGTVLSGCLFGVTPIMFWSADVPTQFALTVVAFALTLASIQFTISHAHVSQAYALSILLPFVARNALKGARYSYLIAALELTAILFFCMAAGKVAAMWKESLQNRLRNQMLVEQLEKQATQLQHDANHDVLTGLPNRAVFFDRLEHVIARAGRQQVKCAVVYFDLDRFKSVNDTYGHYVGDELLRQVAEGVSATTREGDTFCRLSGDEFVILAEAVTSSEGAIRIAETVQSAVRAIAHINAQPIDVSASIGIAMFPHSTENEEARRIVARADLAMYVSKKNGRGTHTVFHDGLVTDYPTYKAGGDVRLQVES